MTKNWKGRLKNWVYVLSVRILGNILYRDRDDLTINIDDLTESQLVEIAAKPINNIFGIIYRPMNNKLVKFKECLAELLQKLDMQNKKCVLMGDLIYWNSKKTTH